MITESNLWKWLRVKPQKITEEGYLIMNLKDRHVFMLTILQLVQYIPLNFICQSVTQIPPIFFQLPKCKFQYSEDVWYTTRLLVKKG